MPDAAAVSLTVHGRFFHRGDQQVFLRAVTYGPFPPGKEPDVDSEFARIAATGFNCVRIYLTPTPEELDLAEKHGLLVMATVPWHWDSLFTENPATIADAKRELAVFLQRHGQHPALGALLLANEIRPDLVRFMGPLQVREVIEDLIEHCHALAPALLVAYANFPTTEYLEPRNADFTAFNVYLERQEDFERYVRRLHNIAGDRPLLLTEFGFSTWREKEVGLSAQELEERQAEMLSWAHRVAEEEATAGFTVYSWSDLWFNGGREVMDWSFGLTRRDGSEKPALARIREEFSRKEEPPTESSLFTIAICTRNGGHRLKDNLPHFENIVDPNFELVVVDDGSSDDTRKIVDHFAQQTSLDIRVLTQEPSGLSAARNHAAREGRGEFIVYIDDDARPHPLWLKYLRKAFARTPQAAAAGGPNLPPAPSSRQNAIVTACAGNASHILFTDTTAEHLPGCNFALRRELLLEMGGFDKRYHAAGDDVDVCWRLLDAGYHLAFHPAACVFHDRRPDIKGFFRQQRGYGEAEALLFQKHPQRFGSDGIRWKGFLYSGATLSPDEGAVIYHGPMGEAPYQMLYLRHMPMRALADGYDTPFNRWLLKLTEKLASRQRRKTRQKFRGPVAKWHPSSPQPYAHEIATRRDYSLGECAPRARVLASLIEQGWVISRDEQFADLEKGPLRLILAETIHSADSTTLHLRLMHPPIPVEEVLEKLGQMIAGKQ